MNVNFVLIIVVELLQVMERISKQHYMSGLVSELCLMCSLAENTLVAVTVRFRYLYRSSRVS